VASERPHLSIGEVLTLLRDEFPDITVSKIRFLESQGLIDPERTPSGYRKFYDPDVEKLRWILRQQREHYLPLKVIKGRLGEFEPQSAGDPALLEPETNGGFDTTAGDLIPQPAEGTLGLTGTSLTRTELLRASGLDEARLRELEEFGLLPEARTIGQHIVYDEDALAIAQLARGFLQHGVGARHLKMYKTAAEREVGLFAQVVAPTLKQKNPAARRTATDTVAELTRLGRALSAILLRRELPRSFGD